MFWLGLGIGLSVGGVVGWLLAAIFIVGRGL